MANRNRESISFEVPNNKESIYSSDLRESLLLQLPLALRKKWENADIKQIQSVLIEREKLGYQTIIGYHCSNLKLNRNEFIVPGSDKLVHYATNIRNLYGLKSKFIYFVEGSNLDQDEDPSLGWKTSHSKLRIIGSLELTDESIRDLGAGFARCEYH